jgi:hypothetical protein
MNSPKNNRFQIRNQKIILFVLLLFTGSFMWSQVTLSKWALDDVDEGTPNSVHTDLTSTDFIAGSGVGSFTFSSTGAWSNGWSTTAGIDVNDYYEISMTPNSGHYFEITNVLFGERRSATGIRDFEVRWSDDDFLTDHTIATTNVPDDTADRNHDISGLSINAASDKTIKFRFYAYNAEGGAGTWRINHDTLEIKGNIDTNDDDTDVDGPAVSSQPTDAISSLKDTDAKAVRVFDFDIYDMASNDNLPTKITQITINKGANNDQDWTRTIAGVKLSTDGGTSFVTIGTSVINADNIVIPINSGDLEIPSNDVKSISLYIWLKDSGIIDNGILEFQVVTTDPHGFTADTSGTGFENTFSGAISKQVKIDVTFDEVRFLQQPSGVEVGATMSPDVTVGLTDENGNVDIDADGTDYTVGLTTNGTFDGGAVTTVDAVNGIVTFNTLIFSAMGSDITLTTVDVDGWGWIEVTSNSFIVHLVSEDCSQLFISEYGHYSYGS